MRLALAALLLALFPAAAQAGVARHVDPMIGTFAPGFVVPGAATPFGMVQNSPDTRGEFAYAGYIYNDPTIAAFSLVHLSGPGVKKAGDVGFMPVLGNDRPPTAFDHAREKATAGAYEVTLANGIRVELAAARRAALQRYTFPAGTGDARVVFDSSSNEGPARESSLTFTGPDEVSGHRRGRYPVYWVARFSKPFTSKGEDWAGFDGGTLTARVGISFVDEAGARRNLEAEAPDFDVAAMQASARAAWERELGKVKVTGPSVLDKRSFYTALYHSYLHPNVFEDVDGRYRGADDQIHESDGRTHYANFSSWDTYKAQNQLLALTQPKRYADMLASLLATARESGKLPRWGEQSIDAAHMSGDPAIPMIADGYCRGLLDDETAAGLYEAGVALRARRPAELGALGYLPDRPGTTLEYGVADFALALMADGLGRDEEAKRWLDASLNYRNVLDPETRFVRPRKADGSWHSPFFTFDMTGFQEGNSWQYSWLAPHDARGLFDRMGGDGEVRKRFQEFFAAPPEIQTKVTMFGVVYYVGQYAPGNEHDLQAPWMPIFAGQPWKGAEVMADVRTLFRPTIDGLPGNDDLGGLSAWHVFSAMGFGPVTPGAPFHVIGSPQFERVSIALGKKKALVVEAPGASPLNRYVVGAELGGRELDRAWLFESELLRKGGTLKLRTSATPDKAWATEDRPPSASDAPLSGFGCRP
jgi:predicted alpha-1,2-mannosidase